MANSHLTILPSKGFSRTCCPRVRSEWRQAVDEEQKVRGGGEEGRFGSTVQPRASVPPLPPQSPATFYDPVFYDSTSCTRQACTLLHSPPACSYIRPQKFESILQDTIATFLSVQKDPFPPTLVLFLPLNCNVWYMIPVL